MYERGEVSTRCCAVLSEGFKGHDGQVFGYTPLLQRHPWVAAGVWTSQATGTIHKGKVFSFGPVFSDVDFPTFERAPLCDHGTGAKDVFEKYTELIEVCWGGTTQPSVPKSAATLVKLCRTPNVVQRNVLSLNSRNKTNQPNTSCIACGSSHVCINQASLHFD